VTSPSRLDSTRVRRIRPPARRNGNGQNPAARIVGKAVDGHERAEVRCAGWLRELRPLEQRVCRLDCDRGTGGEVSAVSSPEEERKWQIEAFFTRFLLVAAVCLAPAVIRAHDATPAVGAAPPRGPSATPGLPFSEDFASTALCDVPRTTADWGDHGPCASTGTAEPEVRGVRSGLGGKRHHR